MAPDDALLAPGWRVEPGSRPAARGRYRVRVRGLVLDMSIGVHPHEKRAPQRVRVGVELSLDRPEGGFADGAYRKVACYETLVARIREMAGEGHVVLVETFAERVADLALTDRRVSSVSVEVEKLDIFADCEGVGATVEKSR